MGLAKPALHFQILHRITNFCQPRSNFPRSCRGQRSKNQDCRILFIGCGFRVKNLRPKVQYFLLQLFDFKGVSVKITIINACCLLSFYKVGFTIYFLTSNVLAYHSKEYFSGFLLKDKIVADRKLPLLMFKIIQVKHK